jgi:hypothetical protein
MEMAAIREAFHRRPFMPFTLRLSEGRAFRILHPDYMAVPPTNQRVIVFDNDDQMIILDPLLILSLESALPDVSPTSV